MSYVVNIWGSRPGTDDDCVTGSDFVSREEAEAAYADPASIFNFDGPFAHLRRSGAWVEIDGPDVHEERELFPVHPDHARDVARLAEMERREAAMMAGMAGGCDAYNEAMGWPLGEDG